MKKYILIIFFTLFLKSLSSQTNTDYSSFRPNLPEVLNFVRNDTVFFALVYVNKLGTIDSISITLCQEKTKMKCLKNQCNCHRYKKIQPSKIFLLIKDEISADYECDITGCYISRDCETNTRYLFLFGYSWKLKDKSKNMNNNSKK